MNGLLLINLGTPDDPSVRSVRRYLREFLSDPRVIDLSPVARALLVHLVILPFRPRRSAEAYTKIWTPRGSPLRVYGEDLAAATRARLGDGWRVELAMRYGAPSIADALARLRAAGAERLVVFPLYPQYASSSTGSSLEAVYRALAPLEVVPPACAVEPFYDRPLFLDAFAAVGGPVVAAERPDHVLFSFHGLPERQVRRADPGGAHCLARADCCDRIVAENRACYRAQCFATARGIAERLALPDGRWSVSFQSRLGRTPWIRPHTDVVLPELARGGTRRVAVFCPAFVADCLETLEEIGIRGRESFLAAGGESLALVPSLNATPQWADAVVALVREQAARYGGPPDSAAHE
jgi:ferrochelatase